MMNKLNLSRFFSLSCQIQGFQSYLEIRIQLSPSPNLGFGRSLAAIHTLSAFFFQKCLKVNMI